MSKAFAQELAGLNRLSGKVDDAGEPLHPPGELGENPKDRLGALKVPLHLIPKAGLLMVSKVMQLGAEKYGAYNWRKNKVREQVYIDAASRHLLLAEFGEDTDDESRQAHYAHAASCMLILLDAKLTGNLIDDRVKCPEAIAKLKELTEVK